jgi:hypothetical protein
MDKTTRGKKTRGRRNTLKAAAYLTAAAVIAPCALIFNESADTAWNLYGFLHLGACALLWRALPERIRGIFD